MAYIIRKSFTMETAHQLRSAFTQQCSDCVHGHSYTVELELTCRDQFWGHASYQLDPDHMVVDFGKLKPFINTMRERYDHGVILPKEHAPWWEPLIEHGILKECKVHFWDDNPTAEVLARHIFNALVSYVRNQEWNGVGVVAVRVHETATGWAEWREAW